MDEANLRGLGASWVGRTRPLSVREFRHQFGVYPQTVVEISKLRDVGRLKPKYLLRALWWLKVYPTDIEIKNHGASDTNFRHKLWEALFVLRDALPEVRIVVVVLARFCVFFQVCGKLPFHQRRNFNAATESLADQCAFILDTTTIKTYMPHMEHGDWDRFGRAFWNHHKRMFGVKLEIAAATQRRPVPLACTVVPAGMHDLTVARLPGGVFSLMRPGEQGLGDPGYLGEPDKIYAPPRRNMNAFVAELDKSELNLQRRVEMLNRHIKEFNVLGTTYRKGARRAYRDLRVIAVVVTKLVYIDMLFAQEFSGQVHTTGPVPDLPRPIPRQKVLPVQGFGARFRLLKRIQERSANGQHQQPMGKRQKL
jgi:hypothetical protein